MVRQRRMNSSMQAGMHRHVVIIGSCLAPNCLSRAMTRPNVLKRTKAGRTVLIVDGVNLEDQSSEVGRSFHDFYQEPLGIQSPRHMYPPLVSIAQASDVCSSAFSHEKVVSEAISARLTEDAFLL